MKKVSGKLVISKGLYGAVWLSLHMAGPWLTGAQSYSPAGILLPWTLLSRPLFPSSMSLFPLSRSLFPPSPIPSFGPLAPQSAPCTAPPELGRLGAKPDRRQDWILSWQEVTGSWLIRAVCWQQGLSWKRNYGTVENFLIKNIATGWFFSLNWPTGPIQSLSRNVRLCLCMCLWHFCFFL